jgi:hypothetical protein
MKRSLDEQTYELFVAEHRSRLSQVLIARFHRERCGVS